VRPRITGTELSGVSTLITGAYIELDPGPADAPLSENFKGLETPPATNRNVPGLRLTLVADQAGSLATGAPIYFRGFEVGRIEGRKLSKDGSQVSYDAFISKTYSGLVTENTRFWNTSGIDISAGADGFKLRTPSFQAMISGGVSFGVTQGEEPGIAAADGRSFTLYKDEEFAKKSSFDPTMRLLLLFDQTVRGLSERAPVEYRGITIGRVSRISFDLMPGAQNMSVPVLIEIDPRLMVPENPNKEKDADMAFIRQAVDKGLRGALKTGSLITGALFVDLELEVPAGQFYSKSTFKVLFSKYF
jgi:paraquat-inducible protein B